MAGHGPCLCVWSQMQTLREKTPFRCRAPGWEEEEHGLDVVLMLGGQYLRSSTAEPFSFCNTEYF